MARINTTPRALTIENFSLNTKFEFLESILCGEIIAMKSYFTDELQWLKNETTINKEQDFNTNTEETTTLKNKIKLLEHENKLLKDDVTDKKKFIDTILQNNLNLSQNFDVSRIIPVTNEARKQPPERQHYEKKGTELNKPQKQEENISSEKSNEKNGSNKEKNRSSCFPTDKNNKSVYILGDRQYNETRRRMKNEEFRRQRSECLYKKFFRGKGKMYQRLYEARYS